MTRDWGGLGAIRDEARLIKQNNDTRPLVDCPICGTRLDRNSRNVANCPQGHFRTTAQTWGELGMEGTTAG